MLEVPEVGLQGLYIGSSPERSLNPSPSGSPGTQDGCSIAPLTPSHSPKPEPRSRSPQPAPFSVVVAIDFGTTSSGYAFSFANDPETIHMMKKWEGGDPGVAHQKTPTCLLLTPEGAFHSFGYTARDHYHDLDPEEARDWLYFEKFKMKIHTDTDLSLKTQLEAVNGQKVPALEVFAHSLRFFKERALQELRELSPSQSDEDMVRWVLTVPAIWKPSARQFMREAAYLAGLASREEPGQLLIALEPEAASLYCRQLRLHQLLDLGGGAPGSRGPGQRRSVDSSFRRAREQLRRSRHSRTFLLEPGVGELWAEMQAGDSYVVADCGGGTVDLTVHQLEQPHGTLKELYTASGGPCGAVGVDLAFERLLGRIFGEDFIAAFKRQRPAAWVDLTVAFEARKRTAGPQRSGAVNISLPFSFIDFFRRQRGHSVETALRRSSVNFVKWSSQGMLRMSCEAMNELFQPTVNGIIQHLEAALARPEARGAKLVVLVGGFAEAAALRRAAGRALGARGLRALVPGAAALSVLRGAVLFGRAPGAVRVRRCALTLGVAVLRRFEPGLHPESKLLRRGGRLWCADVFERLVAAGQPVAPGERVVRSFCPARPGQRRARLGLFCCAAADARFVTDPGVRACGALSLRLGPEPGGDAGGDEGGDAGGGEDPARGARGVREIRAALSFGDTEVTVTALDVATNRAVRATLDFLAP